MQDPAGEWTQVGKGKRRAHPASSTVIPPLAKGIAVSDLADDFQKKSRVWTQSSCRKRLLQIISKQQPDEGWSIRAAVCLASGSFSRDNWEGRRRSMLQFVAFMDIVKHMREISGQEEIAVCAQDPMYTEVDVSFLESLDITCLHAPEAERRLDGQSLAYVPFLERNTDCMRSIELADLPLYIGTPIAEGALNTIQSYNLPVYEEDPNVFEGLVVRWRVSREEDVGNEAGG